MLNHLDLHSAARPPLASTLLRLARMPRDVAIIHHGRPKRVHGLLCTLAAYPKHICKMFLHDGDLVSLTPILRRQQPPGATAGQRMVAAAGDGQYKLIVKDTKVASSTSIQ